MRFETIYHTTQEHRIIIIRQLFTEHKIRFRVLNEGTNAPIPVGKRVQVPVDQLEQAKNLLKEHGFLGSPKPDPETKENKRHWIILFLALLLVILFSIIINAI